MSTTRGSSRSEHPWLHCSAGVTGGALATVLFYPLDFLRTRMHVLHQGSRTKPLCSAREIINREGLRGMYRGIGVAVASHSLGWGMYLLTFHSAHRHVNHLVEQYGYESCSASSKDFMSACVAAGVTGTMLTPLQVLKTRKQLHQGNLSSTSKLGCKAIVSNEGWRSLFKGVAPQILLTGNTTIQVTLYEFFRRSFFTNKDDPSPVQVATASAVSKAISSALFNPFEVLRTRIQANRLHHGSSNNYNGMMNGLATIWRTEGIAGMYRGLPVNVLRVMPSTVVAFIAYEKLLAVFTNAHQSISHLPSLHSPKTVSHRLNVS